MRSLESPLYLYCGYIEIDEPRPSLDSFSMATLPNHEELLAQLRGSTFTVPDFSLILSKWPSKANQNYQQIKDDVESYIDRSVTEFALNIRTLTRE